MPKLTDEKEFPRLLSKNEKDLVFCALPENKPGYKKYREKLDNLFVIGFGRFGGGNIILGRKDDNVDLNVSSAPILAAADITFPDKKISVIVHEELFEQIEIDIRTVPGDFPFVKQDEKIVNSISEWSPVNGYTVENIREINFTDNKFVLAVAPSLRRLWIYECSSGINYFLPVSSFYNELMRFIGDRNPETALHPDRLFSHLSEFSDEQLANAFINYNKFVKRVDASGLKFEPAAVKPNKKTFFGFLKNR